MRLVYVGIALTVLLGIAAFVSRGHRSPAGSGAHDRAASQWLGNVVFTVWMLAMFAGAILFVYLQSIRKRDANRSRFQIRPLLTSLLFFAVVLVGMVLLYNKLGHRQHGPNFGGGAAKVGNTLQKAERQRLKAHQIQSPTFVWPLAAGFAALVFGASVTALIRSHRRRSNLIAELEMRQQLANLVDETLDDLRAEADPRKAVIAAYARMERILGVHGLERHAAEAPLEYLSRVLAELHVTEPAVRQLTELFERAKFSHHAVDHRMKDEAIEALEAFRDEMRAIGARPEPRTLLPEEVPGAPIRVFGRTMKGST
jgi:uncharacterized protein DUF4129